MSGRSTNLTVVILILTLITGSLGITTGNSHENFEDAEEDISALLHSLEQTRYFITSSLENSIRVNYTYQIFEEYVEYGYCQESMDASLQDATDARDIVRIAAMILDDLDDVPSQIYLEQYYAPHYGLIQDLVHYGNAHRGLTINITEAIEHHNKGIDDIDLVRGLRRLENASMNLGSMEEYLEDVEEGCEELKDLDFEVQEMEYYINENFELLSYYEELIDDLLDLFKDIPSHLSLYAPAYAHPGESISVHGYYIEEGVFTYGTTIEISSNHDYRGTVETVRGYFELEIDIGWDRTGDMIIRASPEGKELFEDVLVSIQPYQCKIILDLPGHHFFHEDIPIKGVFITDAPLPLTGFELVGPLNKNIVPDDDGAFEIIYHSEDFDWGINTVTVYYVGNESILSSDASVEIDISIPTEISLGSNVYGYFDNLTAHIELYGTLEDIHHGEGMVGRSIVIEGTPVYLGETTDENGTYSIETSPYSMGMSPGLYVITAYYPGNLTYRDCRSEPLFIFINKNDTFAIGETPDDIDEWADEDIDPDELVAYYEVNILSTYRKVKRGEQITIIYTVENTGNTSGTQEIYFKVNGRGDILLEELSLEPGSLYQGELFWVAADVGDHKLEISSEDTWDAITVSVVEEDDTFLQTERDYIFLFIGIILVMILALLGYFKLRREKEDIKPQAEMVSETGIRKMKIRRFPEAETKEDISKLYGNMVRTMDLKGVVKVTKGKTHRDILRESSGASKIHGYLRVLTDIFEKAFFSPYDITHSEIAEFNRVLKGLDKEVNRW